MCRKIRHAFSSNPAIRAFHRISSHPHQEPKPVITDSNSPSSTPTNIPIQTKHHKTNIENSGAIPIKFEKSSARPTKGDDGFKGGEQQHSSSEKQGKKSMDINDTFNDYIKRAKVKIRTVSNLGRGQSNPTTAPDHDQAQHHGTTNKKDSNKDQFSDFIHRAKKKIRTTTIVGKRG
ncbi:hypothetical protein RIF29_23257 [Crotalaria pallida]|uniref:Uncharacterized protein n=1 Tax=Crotalaria pallida TaxID=3830 RepID=A0AAN9IAV2_CROPI